VTVLLNGTLVPGPATGCFFQIRQRGRKTGDFCSTTSRSRLVGRPLRFGVPRPVAPGSSVLCHLSRDLEARPGRSLQHPPADLVRRVPWISGYRWMTGGISAWKAGWRPGRETKSGYRTSRISVLLPATVRPLFVRPAEAQVRRSGIPVSHTGLYHLL